MVTHDSAGEATTSMSRALWWISDACLLAGCELSFQQHRCQQYWHVISGTSAAASAAQVLSPGAGSTWSSGHVVSVSEAGDSCSKCWSRWLRVVANQATQHSPGSGSGSGAGCCWHGSRWSCSSRLAPQRSTRTRCVGVVDLFCSDDDGAVALHA